MVDCLIAFGANEGDPESNFRQVVESLRTMSDIEVTAVGELCATEPIGGPSGQSAYLNASIRLSTTLSVEELHLRLIEIENQLGRERRARWGSRKVDLDLLLYGEEQTQTERLTVPHPRMSFRRFVLEPSLKIAGDMIHPTSGKSIVQLLEHLRQRGNLAVWVNASAEFVSSFNDSLQEHDHLKEWDVKQVSSIEQFVEVALVAKLVIVFGAKNDKSRLVENALKFPGPMLDLRSSEHSLEEVIAALAAMR